MLENVAGAMAFGLQLFYPYITATHTWHPPGPNS